MNPPTPGHLLLIQKLIEEAIRQNVPKVFVILSKTNNNNENPIECQEKINVLSENIAPMNNMVIGLKNKMKIEAEREEADDENISRKIDSIEVIFLCVKPNQLSPIFPLFEIVRSYSETPNLNLFMIVGDDRADFLDTIADSFLFKNENINSVNGQILVRTGMDELKNMTDEQLARTNISSLNDSVFSASFVRKLVKLGMKDKFDDVYRPYLSQEKINHLYEIISEGLAKFPLITVEAGTEAEAKIPKKKIETEAKLVNPSKYTYPFFRGDRQYNETLENNRLREIQKAEEKANKAIKDAENKAIKDAKKAEKTKKTEKGGKGKTHKKYRKYKKSKKSKKSNKHKKYKKSKKY
jgi:nicotinic acid mononucleotide adenylyltransferase